MPGKQHGAALLLPTHNKASMTKFQIRIIAIIPQLREARALTAS